MRSALVFSLVLLCTHPFASAQKNLVLKSGKVFFTSQAPLEVIQAQSIQLRGLVNFDQSKFAFSVDMTSFTGFNSPLQKEHFDENYMETDHFPKATFSGKLIDKFNPLLAEQTIRAKGVFDIHGVSKERILEILISRSGGDYHFTTTFNIALEDHGITIPKIVYQKISENVQLKVDGNLAAQ